MKLAMNDENAVTPEEIERRTQWFEGYIEVLNNKSVCAEAKEGVVYSCPCCGYKTLKERGGYEICSVCFWEDDGQDEQDAGRIRGGPNGSLSLTEARSNYQQHKACEARFQNNVRPPRPEEM